MAAAAHMPKVESTELRVVELAKKVEATIELPANAEAAPPTPKASENVVRFSLARRKL